jgi:Fic family protein
MAKWEINFNMNIDVENRELITLIAECNALAPVINGIPITPRRQKKIDALNIIRAVRGTTGIEGAEATEEEVRQILDAPAKKRILPPSRGREEQEIKNARELMKYVADLFTKNPKCILTEELICKLHEITTKNINYERNAPGKYRDINVRVGNYNPPPPSSIKDLMAQFIYCFNEGSMKELDPVLRAIVAHFYVVSIHPFADGNGRTSRAIESCLLFKAGINARGFYSLSNYYYKNRAEYMRRLDEARFSGKQDLTPFALFAVRGLAQELKDVHFEVMIEVREIAYRDYAREKLQDKLSAKLGKRLWEFILTLGASTVPIKSIKQQTHPLSQLYRGLNPKTLSRDIDYLKNSGLIIEQNGNIKANLDIMGSFLPPDELVG